MAHRRDSVHFKFSFTLQRLALGLVLLPAAAFGAQDKTAASATKALTQTPEAPTTSATPSASAAKPDASSPTSLSTARAPDTTKSALPPLTLPQQIERMQPLTGTGIDVAAQSKLVLTHLTEVLRYYRRAVTPMQKAGDTSDLLYAEQAETQATQIAQLAFQSAKNEAALLGRIQQPGAAAVAPAVTDDPAAGGANQTQSQRLMAARASIAKQIADLNAVDAANDALIARATAKTRPPLLEKQEQIDGEMQLLQAMAQAVARVSSFNEAQSGTGLAGDVDRLERSVPELAAASSSKPVAPPTMVNTSDIHQAGVSSQASTLFELLSARRNIDQQIAATDTLQTQANALRTPFMKILHDTMTQGQQLSTQAVAQSTTAPAGGQQQILATRQQFLDLTARFHALSDAMLPLAQESLLLDSQRATLTGWRTAVNAEYQSILRSLLLRLVAIAIALGVLALISTVWSRATVRYVADLRRRRQLLLVRRIVIGFLGGLIVIFGFITQFSSLATFAGFITAGIAVGLQTILLSVAAYFFIIGRYGVRVGDRITVAGVTGTVIEVGLARFYLMELVGSGTELHSTGRVAVFANSVLFQTGTPLYKQLPGTEYAWHELTAKLKPEADTEAVAQALCAVVERVYAGYKGAIDAQQQQIEGWMGAAIDPPKIESHLRMVDDGLQLAVLFPVQIESAGRTDAAIARSLVQEIAHEGPLKAGLVSMPVIRASIKNA